MLPGASAAAADFVAASLLLAPDRRATHLTRALVRLQHGDEQGARADLAIVADESPGRRGACWSASCSRCCARSTTGLPGSSCMPIPLLADLGAGLVRELDEVRAAVGVYATRIGARARPSRG